MLLAWLCLRRCRCEWREWRECREHWDGNGDVDAVSNWAPVRCGSSCVAVSGRVAELVAMMLVLPWAPWVPGSVALPGPQIVLGACGGTLGVSPPMRVGCCGFAAAANALAMMLRSVESWARIAGPRGGGGPGGGGGGGRAAWCGPTSSLC